jgi:hypothetical protein
MDRDQLIIVGLSPNCVIITILTLFSCQLIQLLHVDNVAKVSIQTFMATASTVIQAFINQRIIIVTTILVRLKYVWNVNLVGMLQR